MDKILHYPQEGIYHNSHSLGSLGSCRILSINSISASEALEANRDRTSLLQALAPSSKPPYPRSRAAQTPETFLKWFQLFGLGWFIRRERVNEDGSDGAWAMVGQGHLVVQLSFLSHLSPYAITVSHAREPPSQESCHTEACLDLG